MTDPKREERDQRGDDDLKVPEDRVEDLEPGEDEAGDVKGGAFKQGFPIKWSGEG